MHTTKRPGWEESAALLDWGFANADSVVGTDTLNPLEEAAAAPDPQPQPIVAVTPRTAAAVGSTTAMPWYSWVVLALVGCLGLLRTRVVVLRRRRQAVSPLWRQPAR